MWKNPYIRKEGIVWKGNLCGFPFLFNQPRRKAPGSFQPIGLKWEGFPPNRLKGKPSGLPFSLFFGRLDEKKFCLLQVLRYRRVVNQTSTNCYKSFKFTDFFNRTKNNWKWHQSTVPQSVDVILILFDYVALCSMKIHRMNTVFVPYFPNSTHESVFTLQIVSICFQVSWKRFP